MPKLEHRLPKHALTEKESEKIINMPDINEPLGIRDRAILEVLYSTGMRRMELIGLKHYDLDQDRATVMIRQGKGVGHLMEKGTAPAGRSDGPLN